MTTRKVCSFIVSVLEAAAYQAGLYIPAGSSVEIISNEPISQDPVSLDPLDKGTVKVLAVIRNLGQDITHPTTFIFPPLGSHDNLVEYKAMWAQDQSTYIVSKQSPKSAAQKSAFPLESARKSFDALLAIRAKVNASKTSAQSQKALDTADISDDVTSPQSIQAYEDEDIGMLDAAEELVERKPKDNSIQNEEIDDESVDGGEILHRNEERIDEIGDSEDMDERTTSPAQDDITDPSTPPSSVSGSVWTCSRTPQQVLEDARAAAFENGQLSVSFEGPWSWFYNRPKQLPADRELVEETTIQGSTRKVRHDRKEGWVNPAQNAVKYLECMPDGFINPPSAFVLEEPPFRIHHLNYNLCAVFDKSYTAPEVSLWAILSATVKHHGYSPEHLRQSILTAQTRKLVDPVYYNGPHENLLLTGNKLREAVTGQVQQCFPPIGDWPKDRREPDEDRPCAALPVCNYWICANTAPLPLPYFFDENSLEHCVLNLNNDGTSIAPFTRKGWQSWGPSPLRQVCSVNDDLEYPVKGLDDASINQSIIEVSSQLNTPELSNDDSESEPKSADELDITVNRLRMIEEKPFESQFRLRRELLDSQAIEMWAKDDDEGLVENVELASADNLEPAVELEVNDNSAMKNAETALDRKAELTLNPSIPPLTGNAIVANVADLSTREQQQLTVQATNDSNKDDCHKVIDSEESGSIAKWLVYAVPAFVAGVCLYKHLWR